ncbi:hypothetical protein [Bacillus mycoides]|uniref:hypothetical protein n=1 Tax=Bacillus mycoides TaxID=1405 RepID=UPI003A7F7585
MEWSTGELNTSRKEKIYTLNKWIIGWDDKESRGYVGKEGRLSIVSIILADGTLSDANKVPNYVKDKINEIVG